MDALKVTISGTYKGSNGDIIDFEDLTGVIPFTDESRAKMHVQSRCACEWLRKALNEEGKRVYPIRVDMVRQVFIDELEPTQHNFSFVGKDIKKMNYEELQDLAISKDLRRINLPKMVSGVDIREMRTNAYLDYSAKVLGIVIDDRKPLSIHSDEIDGANVFNFAKLPPITVDGEYRADTSKRISNDDVIAMEQKPMDVNETPQHNMTLEELRQICKENGVDFHHNEKVETLYKRLYRNSGS